MLGNGGRGPGVGDERHIAPHRRAQDDAPCAGPNHPAQGTARAARVQPASLCVVATNSSSLRRAAPLAITARA